MYGRGTTRLRRCKSFYSTAKSTIAWLGDTTSTDESAFAELHNCIELMPLRWSPWESWYQLFRKTYWKRVWIIHELILAKELMLWCGALRGDAAEFWRFGRSDGNVHVIRDTTGWRILALTDCWWSTEVDRETRADTLSLQRLSATFATSKSTDPRDYVYAFLGTAYETLSSNAALSLRPDYTRSAVQVLVDVLQSHYIDHNDHIEPDDHIEPEVSTEGVKRYTHDESCVFVVYRGREPI
jgi:hypothetical protein